MKKFFWTNGYWLATVEAAIAKAEKIASAYGKSGGEGTPNVLFTHTGEPSELTQYATKATGAWTFASTGYAIAGTA